MTTNKTRNKFKCRSRMKQSKLQLYMFNKYALVHKGCSAHVIPLDQAFQATKYSIKFYY